MPEDHDPPTGQPDARTQAPSGGAGWIDGLPDELDAQRRLLRGIAGWCERDLDVHWLVIGCSLARGNADALSDVDIAMGAGVGQVDVVVGRFVAAADELGERVEQYEQALPGLAKPHRRVFVQYADHTQVDLVVLELNDGALPGCVVLYDPEGVVRIEDAKPGVTAGDVRTWACEGWEALANLGKYLRRGSLWEARDRLEEARSRAWQLFAAAEGVEDPQFGMTSVFDDRREIGAPDEIDRTFAGLDRQEILGAARQLAEILADLQHRLAESGHENLPGSFAAYVLRDLAALE